MNYSQNGDKFYYNIVVKNKSPHADANVVVEIDALPTGITFISSVHTQGNYNPTTRKWTIPTMPGRSTTSLKLWFQVDDVDEGPFTITYTVTGTLVDNDPANNSGTLTATQTTCEPGGGASNIESSCLCGNVSLTGTPCTYGTTEYRLDADSLVNCVNNYWETATGRYGFTPIDPTLDATFTYDLWCVSGVDEFQKSCGVVVTINPQLVDKDIFDHILTTAAFNELTDGDKSVIEIQHPGQVIAGTCWRLLKNANGDTTSGELIDCTKMVDTKAFYFCTETDCADSPDPCPCPTGDLPTGILEQLPDGYVAQEGDSIFVQHPNAHSAWSFDGSLWSQWSCGCIFKISQDPGNLLKLGTDGAMLLTIGDVPGAVEPEKQIAEVYDSTTRNIGDTGLTVDVTTLFPAAVPGETYTYALKSYNTLAYENVTLVLTTLTYDIKGDAPVGFVGFINIERTTL